MKKLKRILLINWLYFSKELIEVDDVNFLTGKNGAGKSTVIDALQIVLLGETNARNFNQAANEKSQRTLDGYLRADMDENSPCSRRGKDFSSYIALEYLDENDGSHFVTGVLFDCRSDGSRQDRFFIYGGTIPEACFIDHGEAMELSAFRKFIRSHYSRPEIYDSQREYRKNMLSHWNVHNDQVLRMMKKAVSFRPIVDIQKFITENICDIPDKPDIDAMQQNIRDYKRHEQLAQQQEEKLAALQNIGTLYQEMNQAIERWQIHSFLVKWAKKEATQGKIDHLEHDKKDCIASLAETKQKIENLEADIHQKEQRKDELHLAYLKSDIYQAEDNLRRQKDALLQEQKNTLSKLQTLSLDIRKESDQHLHLYETITQWEEHDLLLPVMDAIGQARNAFSALTPCTYELFSKPFALFERVQETSNVLETAMQTAFHKIDAQRSEIRTQLDQKNAALVNLRKNIKDYPRGLLSLKRQLSEELERKAGHAIQIDILADVLELSNEHWRGAVEGYLNTQKFYLLVDPTWYQEALSVYDRIKSQFGTRSFGLVDIGKLRERERIDPRADSLAKKIETSNSLARTYVDYLLGRVICCKHVNELRRHKTAITADGMLYQGYVARPLRRDWMEDAFIGRQAVALRIHRLEEEISEMENEQAHWAPIHKTLSHANTATPLFTQRFLVKDIASAQKDYLRGLEITKELADLDEQLSHLNLLWLNEQKATVEKLGREINELRKQKEAQIADQGRLKERIRQLDYDDLPTQYQDLTAMEDQIEEDFPVDYQQKIGIPRYEAEFSRLKKAATVYHNFSASLAQSDNAQKSTQKKLFEARRDYVERFQPCSFRIETMCNDEFEEERKRLEESELPKYKEKIRAARESAMEQFQNDFLARLKSSIDQVQTQVKSLNKALRLAKFGTDSYQFRADKNPDYADYYDMIMAPELMEGDLGLFAQPFQEKYGPLIDRLFSQITMGDDTQLNARKQTELQQNIDRYTDYRTYLKFDLETTDQNGSKQMLSQTLNTKSGGETQTPFYIAVLASFAQLYRVNNQSDFGNTVRLVVFDEAFNKMDSDRITESVHLLRKMGLQAIICTPPDKVADIMPIADRTLLVDKTKYRMHILPFSKEMLQ